MVQGISKYLSLSIWFGLVFLSLNSPAQAAQSAENSTGNTLEILFFANANALLENCHCGTPSLGGLARLSTIVTRKRHKNPKLMLIDGGDFFNPYDYAKLNLAVLQIYRILQPTILSLGEQEFVQGTAFLRQNLSDWRAPVTSNFVLKGWKSARQRVIRVQGNRVTFLTYLDKSSFDVIPFDDKHLFIDSTGFKRMYNKGVRQGYLIVIFHGSDASLRRFIKKHSEVDLILAGHTQQEKYNLTAKPAVVYGGVDTRFIYDITIDFGASRNPLRCQAVPVGEELPQDKRILPIIKKFKADP